MAPRRIFGGNGIGAGLTDSQRTKDERIALVQMREARQRRFSIPPLFTCDPQGKDDDVKLENHLRANVEPELRDQAGAAEIEGRPMNVLIAISDKSFLSGITLLGGESCGDLALAKFCQATALAMGDVEAGNGSDRTGLYLTRLGRRSDEGALAIGAPGLLPTADVQFKMALELEMTEMMANGLSGVMYTAEVPTQRGMETRELSLKAFSRMLNHREIVIAGNFKIAKPAQVRPDAKPGFILDEIRKLENSEAEIFDRIPKVYSGNGGLPEVRTPFRGSLKADGKKRMSGGTFVEIKLEMTPEQARGFLAFTADKRDADGRLLEAGTRKGYSEIFSGRGGMRFLNTFFGKARSNSILTPVTLGMGDIQKNGIDVVPVSGGYLQYWIDAPDCMSTAEMVTNAIRARINRAAPIDDFGYVNIRMKPSVYTMDAAGIDLDDVRAKFILKSLNRGIFPVEALSRADFLVNFLWHVNSSVQEEIFGRLVLEKDGGPTPKLSDLHVVDSIRWICSTRRTIRDTEDFIWTLRGDPDLPAEISSKREEIEKEFWNFSFAYQPRLFQLLTDKIRHAMDGGYG